MLNIAIFASGEGTNAENLIRYFQTNPIARIAVVLYNREQAGVKLRAEKYGVPAIHLAKVSFLDEKQLMPILQNYHIDFIVLSGFLLLIPPFLLTHYSNKIVNIHPALIPKHCGKGMYGMKVHEEVVVQGDTETGITIHLIDENYDNGRIVFQSKCPVFPQDTAEDVAQRVHALEYQFYPKIVESLLTE